VPRHSHIATLRSNENAEFARRLRRDMTNAERRLWRFLRAHRLEGWSVRRQVPLGPFVADFVCEEAGVIIEIDGGQHAERTSVDEERTRWLEANGYRVVRFWNNEVLGTSTEC
jgi:very-short-patch-repair endonuclease